MDKIQNIVQLINTGQASAAILQLKQLLAVNARHAIAQQLLGVAYIITEECKLAEKHLRQAIKLQPDYAEAYYNLARLYVEQKKYNKAASELKSVHALRKDWPQALFLSGLVAVSRKQFSSARHYFLQVIQLHPDNYEAMCNLANVLVEEGDFATAITYYQQALEVTPNYSLAVLGLASSYAELNQTEQSYKCLKRFLENCPDIEVYTQLAVVCKDMGLVTEAKQACLQAIKISPTTGSPYRLYADAHKFVSEYELDFIKQGLNQDNLEDEELKQMYFALAKACEDIGQFKPAIQAYDKANSLHRKTYSYATKKDLARLHLFQKAYSKDRLDKLQELSNDGEDVIFIVGMPRSGTSLVEQILASHSLVDGAGEQGVMGSMWSYAGAASEAKFHLKLLDKPFNERINLGQRYLQQISQYRTDNNFVTDKMPHNFWQIGQIAAILPKAKIIHCQRHPAATCLSIYKAYFSGTHSYAYNQAELAHYYNIYDALMAHWREVFPGRLYEIQYENLVAKQQAETEKLLQHCHLDWEDACLEFYRSKRKVTTSSAYQVRQPMHSKSVDLWQRYGEALQPLIDVLHIPDEYRD
jgi:tetratricopeptide (TPR) repeat protein